MNALLTTGSRWLPRINVVESKTSYVITVELPGVEINDIRVEIDDKKYDMIKYTYSLLVLSLSNFRLMIQFLILFGFL